MNYSNTMVLNKLYVEYNDKDYTSLTTDYFSLVFEFYILTIPPSRDDQKLIDEMIGGIEYVYGITDILCSSMRYDGDTYDSTFFDDYVSVNTLEVLIPKHDVRRINKWLTEDEHFGLLQNSVDYCLNKNLVKMLLTYGREEQEKQTSQTQPQTQEKDMNPIDPTYYKVIAEIEFFDQKNVNENIQYVKGFLHSKFGFGVNHLVEHRNNPKEVKHLFIISKEIPYGAEPSENIAEEFFKAVEICTSSINSKMNCTCDVYKIKYELEDLGTFGQNSQEFNDEG